MTLYPSHAELTINGQLTTVSAGEHNQQLPLPTGLEAQLDDVLSLTLPAGAQQLMLSTQATDAHRWPKLLEGEQVQLLVQNQWRKGVVRSVVDGSTLVIETEGQLQLVPPQDWSQLRLPLTLLSDIDSPLALSLKYRNTQQLKDDAYQLRLAYRGVQWQMRYQLTGDRLTGELVLNNSGEMALDAERFDLLPSVQHRRMPLAMTADSMEMAKTSDVGASSELGLRRYQIERPLNLAAGQSQRLSLAHEQLEQVEHKLLVRDWLFNRLGDKFSPTRQLSLRWPEQAVALPGGQLLLLSEDGQRTLGDTQLGALEPDGVQTLQLGTSSVISVKKEFVTVDKQSARFRLTFTNHSDEPQSVEYWLLGVRQVNQQEVPATEGYRLILQLAPGATEVRQLQGWQEEK